MENELYHRSLNEKNMDLKTDSNEEQSSSSFERRKAIAAVATLSASAALTAFAKRKKPKDNLSQTMSGAEPLSFWSANRPGKPRQLTTFDRTSGGKYYLAYAAEEHISVSISTSPTGPFTQTVQKGIFGGTLKQIDPFILKDEEDKKFLFYIDINKFMTTLKDDFLSVKDDMVAECMRTIEAWENKKQPSARVIEGSEVIRQKDNYYLLYSVNHFDNPSYAVGYASTKNIAGLWGGYGRNPILSRNNVNREDTGHGDLIVKKHRSRYLDRDGNIFLYLRYAIFKRKHSESSPQNIDRKKGMEEQKEVSLICWKSNTAPLNI